MKKILKRCPKCGAYTLQPVCTRCDSGTVSPHPAKFSPKDRYVRYRLASRYEKDSSGNAP